MVADEDMESGGADGSFELGEDECFGDEERPRPSEELELATIALPSSPRSRCASAPPMLMVRQDDESLEETAM